jgi:hypothetical protein
MAKQAEQQGSVDILPDELLVAALEKELDEKYVEAIYAEGAKLFEDADKKFEEGRKDRAQETDCRKNGHTRGRAENSRPSHKRQTRPVPRRLSQ